MILFGGKVIEHVRKCFERRNSFMGNTNRWMGDREGSEIGQYSFAGEKKNSEKIGGICASVGMSVVNAVHIFDTRISMNIQYMVQEQRRLIRQEYHRFASGQKEMIGSIHDVRSIRGLGGGSSDHMRVKYFHSFRVIEK